MIMAHAPVSYHTRTPGSVTSTQESPQQSQYGVDGYGSYYHHHQPSSYNPYAQTHRFSHQAVQGGGFYAPLTYAQPSQVTPTLTSQMSDLGAVGRDRPSVEYSPANIGLSPIVSNEHEGKDGRSSSLTRNASPTGPIKAAGPIIPQKDADGKTWITVEYTKDRILKSHTIRIDIEDVDVDALPYEFRLKNVVYPAVFKGVRRSREKYETECNRTAWALAKLNPILETSKGLRQRAVDHWRNSNSDRGKASRRVRREAKKLRRASQTNALSMRAGADGADGGLPSLTNLSAGHGVGDDGSGMAMSAHHQFSRSSVTGQQYIPVVNAHQSQYVDSNGDAKSYDRGGFATPILRSILPPTPDTLSNDNNSDTSHRSHTVNGSSYADRDGKEHWNGAPMRSQNRGSISILRSDARHFRVNMHTEGARDGHMPGDFLDKASVFPRAVRATLDDTSYGRFEEASPTQTSTPVRLGSSFDEVMAVPLTSSAQQQRDRFWNSRAVDLVKTQFPELKMRPQTIQRMLTRMYRRGGAHRSTSRDSSPGIVQNRPGLHA